MANEEELRAARKAHAETLTELGTSAFPNTFRADADKRASRDHVLHLANDEAARAGLPTEEGLEGSEAVHSLFGRVVAKRGPFLVVRTPKGDAQALVRPQSLPEVDAAKLKTIDLGDHVVVSGPMIQTRTGAAALSARSYEHIGKAMLPPPAKFHGLKDVEKRYRERYVDLFANPDVSSVFRARGLLVQSLRSFLDEREFLEVETPMLHSVRGGATAKPFSTHHNALDLSLFLRIAPELYLKRLIVGGLERVYEIGRNFRNEGISTRHNPEFTMIEYYQAFASYEDLMDQTEEMLRFCDARLLERFPQFAEERSFSLEKFERKPMREAVADRLRASGGALPPTSWDKVLTPEDVMDDAKVAAAFEQKASTAKPERAESLRRCKTYGERIYFLYETIAEEHLTDLYRTEDGSKSLPVFITEYPTEISPLARKNDVDPRWVDRFELFVEGRELCNAFSELNDPDDQAERFHAQLQNRADGDDEAMDFDADYIRALSHGMPPAAGLGMGVDRLTMLLCSQSSIRDVLLFPLLRPGT